MSYDLEQLKFCGLTSSVAESEFSASFTEDKGMRLAKALYQEYQQSDSSEPPSEWLKDRLSSVFLWATEPPTWIESTPMWPFLDGEPMVFIDQFEVGSGSVPQEHLAVDAVLYVFGKRVMTEGGWKMRYRVIEQFRDLP